MSFWIRKYNIELEQLPLALLTKSIIVVFTCLGILASILLLLPIQDKISGEVYIYPKGQALAVNAPSDGFVHLLVDNEEVVDKDDLLATIDVDVSKADLILLDELIENKLTFTDIKKAESLIDEITPFTKLDLRDVKFELQLLLDILQQLSDYARISDPSKYLKSLEKSIEDKQEQIALLEDLDATNDTILLSLQEQLNRDIDLLKFGLLAQNKYDDNIRTFREKESSQIEFELRKHDLKSGIIEDEQVKILSEQRYFTKLAEIRYRLFDQLSNIRKEYLAYQKRHLLLAPRKGYVTIRNDLVNREMVNSGEVLLYLTPLGGRNTLAEMYVGAANAGSIEPQMRVRVGLAEFDQKEYGIYYTRVLKVSEVPQDNRYRITLECELPLTTSYNIKLPERDNYKGDGEILLGQINLLTKISREIHFNKTKYASL